MKTYTVYINGSEEGVEVIMNRENNALFKGADHFYECRFINDNIMLLRVDNRNYILKGEPVQDTDIRNTEFKIDIESRTFKVTCKSELDLLVSKFSQMRSKGTVNNELRSPMPGAIVKINVKEGQKVSKGDVLLVLEAMKMENELKALSDCTVQKILVEEKTSVDNNQVLIKFEV